MSGVEKNDFYGFLISYQVNKAVDQDQVCILPMNKSISELL